MKTSSRHHGVIVPMVTPATPAGDVDLLAATRLADRLAHHGLGIFVLGTTGEAASVPASQRGPLVEAVVRTAAGRVRVYAGIGDTCVAHSIAAGRRYLELGADGVVALVPGYYPLTPAEIEAYFRRVHDGVAGPLMLYNIPVATHHSVPLDVVETLSHLPHVIGYKDSEGTEGRWQEAVRRLGGRPNFALLMGIAAQATAAIRGGFHGVIPSAANLAPADWAEFWRLVQAEDWEAAVALQPKLDATATRLQRGHTLGHYLAGLKYALSLQGVCGADLFPPLTGLNSAQRDALRADFAVREAVSV